MQKYIMDLSLLLERPVPILIVLVPMALNIYLTWYTIKKIARSTLTDTFLFFLFSLLAWQFDDLFARFSRDQASVMFFDKVFSHGWILAAPLGLRFAYKLSFDSSEKISKLTIIAIYLPAIVFMALYSAETQPADYHFLINWGWVNTMNRTPFQTVFLTWYVSLATITLYYFFKAFADSEKGTNRYYKSLLLLIGYAVPAIQGIITQAVFPVLKIQPVPVTTASMSVFSFMALIALRRYYLFNLEDSISTIRLLNSLTDIVIAIGRGNKIAYINANGASSLGYTVDELEGESIFNIISGPRVTDRKTIGKTIEIAFSGQHIETDSIFIKKDGSEIPASLVADAITNGNITEGVLLMARDISEIKKNLEEIYTQNVLTQHLFDASPLAMAMVDIQGITLKINSAFEKMFQYTEDEIVGKRMGAFIIPDELQQEAQTAWETTSKPNNMQFETKRKKKNNEVFDVFAYISLINIHDEIYGVYSIYEDITERKNAEEQLKNQNTELIKVNKELDKFIYSISHDIRAPLMSIKGIVNMAESEEITPDSYRIYMGLVSKNIDNLDEFTSDIIRYYKNTHLEIKPELIDFKKLTDDAIKGLQYLESAQNIKFETSVAKNSGFISDKDKIQIIFNNLISNAIKYRRNSNDQSFIKIKTSFPDDTARIVIEDNGEGIKEENFDRIFDMFTRFSDHSAGSGLGLYIVKEMVDELKGEISVSSRPGEGTSFTLIIPELRMP